MHHSLKRSALSKAQNQFNSSSTSTATPASTTTPTPPTSNENLLKKARFTPTASTPSPLPLSSTLYNLNYVSNNNQNTNLINQLNFPIPLKSNTIDPIQMPWQYLNASMNSNSSNINSNASANTTNINPLKQYLASLGSTQNLNNNLPSNNIDYKLYNKNGINDYNQNSLLNLYTLASNQALNTSNNNNFLISQALYLKQQKEKIDESMRLISNLIIQNNNINPSSNSNYNEKILSRDRSNDELNLINLLNNKISSKSSDSTPPINMNDSQYLMYLNFLQEKQKNIATSNVNYPPVNNNLEVSRSGSDDSISLTSSPLSPSLSTLSISSLDSDKFSSLNSLSLAASQLADRDLLDKKKMETNSEKKNNEITISTPNSSSKITSSKSSFPNLKPTNSSSSISTLLSSNSSQNPNLINKLGNTASNFIRLYGDIKIIQYLNGLESMTDINLEEKKLYRIEEASEKLGVHVRRIYEVIKILEALSIVSFIGNKKGNFYWLGSSMFIYSLGYIQESAMKLFPITSKFIYLNDKNSNYVNSYKDDDETTHFSNSSEISSLSSSSSSGNHISLPLPASRSSSFGNEINSTNNEVESYEKLKEKLSKLEVNESNIVYNPCPGLENIDQLYQEVHQKLLSRMASSNEHIIEITHKILQLFLIGMDSLCLISVIHKIIPALPGQKISDYNRVNATKIRRVYDVANVLCGLNILKKRSINKVDAYKSLEKYNKLINDFSNVSNKSNIFNDLETSISETIKNEPCSIEGFNSSIFEDSLLNIDRTDVKILEWSSFPIQEIRRFYLNHTKVN